MREHLYKAKRVDTNEWIFGYYVFRPDGKHLIYWKPFEDAGQNTYHEVHPDTVCMLWGEHKKAGNIFEGDKVKVQGTKRVGIYETTVLFDGTMFRLKSNKTQLIDSASFVCILEKTGNIHDETH